MTDADLDLAARLARLERASERAETHFSAAFWRALDVAYAAHLPQRRLRCIVCEREAPHRDWEVLEDHCVFGGGRLERYCCPRCGCVFGPQKVLDVDEAFMAREYEMLYARYSEADLTEDEIRTFHSLRPEPGRLYLDWGCGGGWSRTVDHLRAEGWDVWGYEPSAQATSPHVVARREEISARFDGIFSNNVIEHFREPLAQFRDFRRILRDGGRMAHASPCYEYSYAHTRFHTLFLLGRSARVLAERTGFEVVDEVRKGDYINYVFQAV
ncbi:class I SAM-dependent methyltransferase [Phenylobacterium sp.]|uniref:class I SAM-dependent methyltransferase n=1 Tax=Phenylobacterium sp. TaxID=1871053 RepID=UPI002F932DC8